MYGGGVTSIQAESTTKETRLVSTSFNTNDKEEDKIVTARDPVIDEHIKLSKK